LLLARRQAAIGVADERVLDVGPVHRRVGASRTEDDAVLIEPSSLELGARAGGPRRMSGDGRLQGVGVRFHIGTLAALQK